MEETPSWPESAFHRPDNIDNLRTAETPNIAAPWSPCLDAPGPRRPWRASAVTRGHLCIYLSSAGAASGFSSDLGRTNSGCGRALGTERGESG